ncbi:MAG TPA: hypothetical protein VFU16_01860 [Solirubrobacterales bacterium]|nr:hypothetical protein [Solirubrobacterales bacterium]
MSATTLSSDDWGRLLAGHFFRPEYAGIYVLFYVDRPLLGQIASCGEDEAVKSLVAAIVPQLRRRDPDDLFRPLLSQTVSWKLSGGDGPPPCLAALALAVLAASEMRSEGGRAQSNYHAWFRDLIAIEVPDVDAESLWHAYAGVYPALWGNLEWWLEQRHEGKLGRSTIAEDERNTKYGFADSQTIFLSSDREKLSRFFSWIRLRPGEKIAEEELLQYFAIWAGRRDDLSPGARLMLAEEQLEQVQLGRLIAEAAARWEGVARDDEGRLEARVCLTLTRPPSSRLGLAAEWPPGFPQRLEVDYRGERFSLEAEDEEGQLAADEHRWYGELPLPVDRGLLATGLRIEAEGRVLRLSPASVYVFHMSRELGCWAGVDQIRPGEDAWVLVAKEQLAQVRELLERRARPGWSPIERTGVAPPGWTLFREVVVDPVEVSEGEELGRLVPRRSNRFMLSGGLPLARAAGLYLTGGDPDVLLPPLPGDQSAIAVELDGETIELAPGIGAISLAALAPAEGNHAIRVGGVRKSYATVRTLRNISPPSELAVGHELRLGEGGSLWPASLDATSAVEAREDGVRIRGSLVELGPGVPFEDDATPLILPRGPRRRVLISDRPGGIEEVEVPEEPRWMGRAGLACQSFEYTPGIPARWLLVESRLGGTWVRQIERDRVSVDGLGHEESEEDRRRWAELVLACGSECVEPRERKAWERLRAEAEAIL